MTNSALILMAKSPVPRKSKTRLLPLLSPKETVELQYCFLEDIANCLVNQPFDTIVYYLPGPGDNRLHSIFPFAKCFVPQKGSALGARMYNGLVYALNLGYSKAALIGSDLPEMSVEILQNAFHSLDNHDAVIGPADDGGYYLVGLKKAYPPIFQNKKYSHPEVFAEAMASLKSGGLKIKVLPTIADIDQVEDLSALKDRIQGYNSATARFLETIDFSDS